MSDIAEKTFSFFDTARGRRKVEPERFYHGFVLGLLVDQEEGYLLKSNRESGNGRTDLYLKPAFGDMTAYLFEFKISVQIEGSYSDLLFDGQTDSD